MSASQSWSGSARASPDASVAAACHYGTANLPTLAIVRADLVPVLGTGWEKNALWTRCSDGKSSLDGRHLEVDRKEPVVARHRTCRRFSALFRRLERNRKTHQYASFTIPSRFVAVKVGSYPLNERHSKRPAPSKMTKQQIDRPNRTRQSTSAVVLGKLMSVEGIAGVTLRQTGEQAAGLGLVLVAER